MRDEEKSRAKERIYSFRDPLGQWDPKNQRPELWNIFNSRIDKGESIRVFPLSNWTELDIWLYIQAENIPIVPLYFAKEREVVLRNGSIVLIHDVRELLPGESGRFRYCEVPDAFARMRSLHRSNPFRSRHDRGNCRGNGVVPAFGARKPRDRSR